MDVKKTSTLSYKVCTTTFRNECVLFIFDNVENMENIRKFLRTGPSNPSAKSYILLTSRVQEWCPGIEVIQLDEWKPHEAQKFVSAILNDAQDYENDIELLVEELQYFPLALRQATSYIKNQRVSGKFTIPDYRNKYQKQRRDLLASKVFQNGVSKYTETTFTTWNITIKTIGQDSEGGSLALKILNTIAYFAPDNIHRASLIDLANESAVSTVSVLGKYFFRLVVSEVFTAPNLIRPQPRTQKKLADHTEYLMSAVRLLVKYSMISCQNSEDSQGGFARCSHFNKKSYETSGL